MVGTNQSGSWLQSRLDSKAPRTLVHLKASTKKNELSFLSFSETLFMLSCLVDWLFCFVFLDTVLLCGPDWPQSHNPPTSVSHMLGLLSRVTIPNLTMFSWKKMGYIAKPLPSTLLPWYLTSPHPQVVPSTYISLRPPENPKCTVTTSTVV